MGKPKIRNFSSEGSNPMQPAYRRGNWSEDVHEHAMTDMVEVVYSAMEIRVIEDEQRIIDPTVPVAINFDGNVRAMRGMQIEQYAGGQS
jgi:hypothetical protein